MKKIIVALIVVMLIFTGCSKNQNEDLEAKVAELEQQVEELSEQNEESPNDNSDSSNVGGYFDGNQYYNEYLGFSFNFPQEWELQGKEQIEHISKLGNELIAGEDESLKGQLEVAQDTMIKFNLIAYKYPLGTPDKLNPNIIIVGEDISIYTGMNDEEDYIKSIKELYGNSQIEIKIIDEGSVTIKGHEFKVLHTAMTTNGIEVDQVMHVRINKGVAIGAIVTYFDEDSKNEVFDVLHNGYNSMN